MKDTQCNNPRVSYFLKEYQRGVETTNNGIKVSVDWASDPVNRQGLREWFVRSLHRKINWNGNIRLEYRDDRIGLWRDCQIYTAWVQKQQKTQWGIRFNTKYFRKRFSHIEKQMKDRFDECFT
jgi:hypothetical protein